MTKILGLTGGIGSGKTTVSKIFTALGVPVYNADYEAKVLMQSSKKIKSKIIELFGEKSGKWNLPPFSLDKMLTENLIFNCALFRRVDFDNTIGYNPNMKEGWEDGDFWLSILELKKEVVKLELVGFYYRIRSN